MDSGDINEPTVESFTTPTGEIILANKFILYNFKGLKRVQTTRSLPFFELFYYDYLYSLTMKVLKDVEHIGFWVSRTTTDNAETSVKLFDKLYYETVSFDILLSWDPITTIFLSFKYMHFIKKDNKPMVN